MIDGLEPLPALGRFVADLLSLDADDDGGHVSALTIAMPVELDTLAVGDRVVALGAAPPTQHIATSVLPVFHGLRLTLMADATEGDDADTDR